MPSMTSLIFRCVYNLETIRIFPFSVECDRKEGWRVVRWRGRRGRLFTMCEYMNATCGLKIVRFFSRFFMWLHKKFAKVNG